MIPRWHAARLLLFREIALAHSKSEGTRVVDTAARWLAELAADLRYAVRTSRRQPGFAAVAILSLAAGIGLNTAVFSIINTIFFQGIRGVPSPERIVTIDGRHPYGTFRDLGDQLQSVERLAAWQPIQVDIRFREVAVRRVVPAVSDTYFSTLGIAPARGQFFVPAGTRQPLPDTAVVLDYEFWMETTGGDESAIGQTMLIDNVPVTIQGVAPRSFHGFGPERPPLWIPMGLVPAVRSIPPRWEAPAEGGWRIFGRLEEQAAGGEVEAEIRTLALRSPALFPDGPPGAGTAAAAGLRGAASGEKRIEFLLVVVLPLVVVGLILWIGCSNVANLLLARAAARRKEIAIRLANGASRARLVRLLLTESLLLAAAGGAAGLLLSAWTLDLVWATLPEFTALAVEIDANVLIYTACVCVTATLLFGLVPSLHATKVDVAPLLKSEESGRSQSARGARVRTFFLVTQFASSMALLIVAGTFVRTVIASYTSDQAPLMNHLTLAYLESEEASPAARTQYWTRVRETIGRVPDVVSATIFPPAETWAKLVPEGSGEADASATARIQHVDAGYFRTSGLTILAGRDVTADADVHAVEQTMINQRAAVRFWGTTAVVGRRFSLTPGGLFEVAGVAADDGSEARVFRRLDEGAVDRANVLIRTTRPATVMVAPLRAMIVELSADRALVQVATLREASLGGLQRLTRLALIVAGLVLSLATVGLYGSIGFATSQRTREIAIRMAVGAPRLSVLRLLAREGVVVVAAGSVLGLALTALAFRFMSGMLFARWTLDPLTIVGVLAVFSVATLLACYLPGRRALRIDPMRVLRAD